MLLVLQLYLQLYGLCISDREHCIRPQRILAIASSGKFSVITTSPYFACLHVAFIYFNKIEGSMEVYTGTVFKSSTFNNSKMY